MFEIRREKILLLALVSGVLVYCIKGNGWFRQHINVEKFLKLRTHAMLFQLRSQARCEKPHLNIEFRLPRGLHRNPRLLAQSS